MNEMITQTRLGTYVVISTKEPYYSDQGFLQKGNSKEESEYIVKSQLPNKVDKRQRTIRINIEEDGSYGAAHISLRDLDYIQANDNNTTMLSTDYQVNFKNLKKERENNPDFYLRTRGTSTSKLFKEIDKLNKKLHFLRKHHIQ